MSAGETLSGLPPELTLGEPIGEGGMGEVFAATHATHGSVVVKVMHTHLDDAQRDRLRLEGAALARIQSPHVVRIHDWGLTEGRPYLVMERLAGQGLDQVIAQGPLPVERAVRIACDVLRGLSVVHAHKLVHRDVKPDNVFVCPDRAVLLDFGVVKLLERVTGVEQLKQLTRAGSTVGTPRYMSPEQAQAQPVDARADLYSTGALLFRMLTGEHLFSHDTLSRQLIAHVKDPPRAPSQVVGGVPQALDQAVLRALAKRPGDRFDSADAFRQALEAAAGIRAASEAASGQDGEADPAAVGTVRMSEQSLGLEAALAEEAAAEAAQAAKEGGGSDALEALAPGAKVGRYRIERELGRGGMGIVYLAKNDRGDRRAIKTLIFGGKLTEQLVERFKREILLLASIEHVHMVRFYEAGKLERPEGTTMWIALEFLEGRTLRELVDEQGAVEPENVARWCLHIALGVAAAHKLHVVHRDLKPENAALSDEIVKVFDLGIAKWQGAGNATAANLQIGTLAYMAPEQLDPSLGPVDARTDVYALGLILHELATGQHPICPFDEPIPPSEVQMRIIGMVPKRLDEAVSGFPSDLAQIAARCLEKEPSARYQTMREVADALDDVLTRLRTARHAASLADLGVDAGAAHAAARRAKSVSGSDATPPPVVQEHSDGAGGFTPNQPRTKKMEVGEDEIQAWAEEARARREAAMASAEAGETQIAEPGSLPGAAAGSVEPTLHDRAGGVSPVGAAASGGATGKQRAWAWPLVIGVVAVLGATAVFGRDALFGGDALFGSEPAAGAAQSNEQEAEPEEGADEASEGDEAAEGVQGNEGAEGAEEEGDVAQGEDESGEGGSAAVSASSTAQAAPPPAAPPPPSQPRPRPRPRPQPKPSSDDVILIE